MDLTKGHLGLECLIVLTLVAVCQGQGNIIIRPIVTLEIAEPTTSQSPLATGTDNNDISTNIDGKETAVVIETNEGGDTTPGVGCLVFSPLLFARMNNVTHLTYHHVLTNLI